MYSEPSICLIIVPLAKLSGIDVLLFNKLYFVLPKKDKINITYGEYAKQCALIAVDEIINTIEQIFETFEERKYWNEVKQEIEKL